MGSECLGSGLRRPWAAGLEKQSFCACQRKRRKIKDGAAGEKIPTEDRSMAAAEGDNRVEKSMSGRPKTKGVEQKKIKACQYLEQ